MTTDLQQVKTFDIATADVVLWVFKKSVHPTTKAPVFTGRWVETSDSVDAQLRAAVELERNRITETSAYSLISLPNESSALTISSDETLISAVITACADETDTRKVKDIKQLNNADFYAIKLVKDGKVLHAIKRTDTSWKAKKAGGIISLVFSDTTLDLENDRTFNVARNVDFMAFDGGLLISNKSAFEVVLNFKEAHVADFVTLKAEPEFSSILSDMSHIDAYVGTNKMQLRRVCAIKQKGHYKDPLFMSSLKAKHKEFKYAFDFGADGKIIVTPETCKDIFLALLDHRLMSHNDRLYDVPDTAHVG